MLVTKLKMQSSPYGESVISAQTEHLKIKAEKQRERNLVKLKILTFNSLLHVNALNHFVLVCDCVQMRSCAGRYRGKPAHSESHTLTLVTVGYLSDICPAMCTAFWDVGFPENIQLKQKMWTNSWMVNYSGVYISITSRVSKTKMRVTSTPPPYTCQREAGGPVLVNWGSFGSQYMRGNEFKMPKTHFHLWHSISRLPSLLSLSLYIYVCLSPLVYIQPYFWFSSHMLQYKPLWWLCFARDRNTIRTHMKGFNILIISLRLSWKNRFCLC